MQMTDMLLQMALMNAWQLPQVSAPSSQAGSSASQQTTFQDLLEQRKNDLNGSDRQGMDTAQTNTDSRPVDQPAEEKQDPAAVNSDLTALAAGQVLMTNLVVPMDQAMAVQPEGAAVVPVQSAVTMDTALQADAMSLAGAQLQEMQQPVQAPGMEAAAAVNPEQSVPQQAGEMVIPTTAEAGAAEDMTQQMPQTDVRQDQQGQQTEQAAVQSWHTPLFRDVEAAPVKVGDAPVDMTAPAEEVKTSLSHALKGALEQGDQFLEIRLSPANLGNVVAEFTRNPDGALHVVLRAETEQAAKLLSNHASSLGLMLQDSTHAEVRVEVPQPQQEQTAWQQEQNGGQQQRQQQQQQQQQQPRREAESFLHQLRLGLVQMETQAV